MGGIIQPKGDPGGGGVPVPSQIRAYIPFNIVLGCSGIIVDSTWNNTYVRTVLKQRYNWQFQEYDISYAPITQSIVDLSYNQNYIFSVAVTTSTGTSAFSQPSAIFQLTNRVPGPPTNVTVTQTSGTIQPSVTVQWTPPQDTTGSIIESYLLKVTAATDTYTINTYSAATTTTVAISYGVSYVFTVTASTNIGLTQESLPSAPFQLTTGVCSEPTNLTYTLFYPK
jgi:hypothetical protein